MALSEASWSMRGVSMMSWPIKEKSVHDWSSPMMRTMLDGGDGARAGDDDEEEDDEARLHDIANSARTATVKKESVRMGKQCSLRLRRGVSSMISTHTVWRSSCA
jgi:hypothetical protein